jgi:hypothetical protein
MQLKHIIKVLKSEAFDVRNSPLDHIIRGCARIIYCAKFSCEQAATVSVGLSLMLGIDQILANANRPQIFQPYFTSVINTIAPNSAIISQSKVLADIAKIRSLQEDHKAITDLGKTLLENSKDLGFTPDESKALITDINNDLAELKQNQDTLRQRINAQLKDLIKDDK